MFEFLESIATFFQVGIYEFFQEAFKYFAVTLTVWYIEMQIWGLTFAWEVASTVLSTLNISHQIATAMSGLPSQVSQGAQFFRVPEAINLLLTAGVTRLVISLIPGI